AVAATAALARDHLARFKQEARTLPASLRPAYLPVSLVGPYLDAIEADAVDPLEESAAISPVLRHWLLLRRALRGW
ncbi:phytoene/squalene synthase family protein, partial [Nitratireductor sp. GCM10026969]